MDSDSPSASWHPAKRPNSSADDTPFETQPQSEFDDQTQAVEANTSEEAPADFLSEQPASSEQDEAQSDRALDFDHHEHAETSNAPLRDTDTQPEVPADIPTETPAEAPAETSAETPAGNEDVTSPITEGETAGTLPESECASKRQSTMSFTRTVPHEVSFNDDEDAEWSVQPSEPNFFSFMPENDRTNSFPAVSQTENSTTQQFSQSPLPTNTEEASHDLEDGETTEGFNPSPDAIEVLEGNQITTQEEDINFAQNTSMGGDVLGADVEASNIRFEEGLPLISQHDTLETTEDIQDKGADAADFFSQDSGEAGDDFFSQIQDSQPPADLSFDDNLHRKSTTMVMGQIGQEIDSESASPIENGESKAEDDSNLTFSGDTVHALEGEGEGQGASELTTETTDLDAKWAAAFADDDDEEEFLLESATEPKELDPADIFGSDDEGFLDDEEPGPAVASQVQTPQSNLSGSFAPGPVQQQPYSTKNIYAPTPPAAQVPAPQQHPLYSSNVSPLGIGLGAPAPRPDLPKAQSFVDKSKGGYQSPYDLPMEVVKPPKKRASAQPQPRANTMPPPPPSIPPLGHANTYPQPPPPPGGSNLPSTSASHAIQQSGTGPQKPSPQLKSKPNFFEDLPMTSKSRPSSRQAARPTLTQQNSFGQPGASSLGPPMHTSSMHTPPLPSQQLPPTHPVIPALIAPELVSPYASLQSDVPSRPQPPSTVNNRYSPAPPQSLGVNGTMPVAATPSRYSPAPPSSRPTSSYSAVPPPLLAHQPRTSSPLAHFEVSHGRPENKQTPSVNGDGVPLMRTNSSQYEHRTTRVPSLPPTQEVEEEQLESPSHMASKPFGAITEYGRHTPPPSTHMPPPNSLSPSKRSVSQYTPQSVPQMSPKENIVVPPPRPQTQSPGASRGKRGAVKPLDSAPRPSSAHAHTLPQPTANMQPSNPALRTRRMSQNLNLVPPTDGREHDPLQRWRGGPCIAWGVGGLFVSTFPKDVPRYGISSSVPQIIRSPGEVKVKHMRDIQPLEDRLSKFPGPLKGKSKKKEVVAWLTAGISGLEAALPDDSSFQRHVSHEDKRAAERVLLWKVLRLLVEHDGVLEGTPAVDMAVRGVISPGLSAGPEEPSVISTGANLPGLAGTVGAMQADATDSTVTESIRRYLLLGDREKAVWAAVDKRLWGHAILISSSIPKPELYRQVAQEFIKKEVNHAGHGNESLAALYSVLSGNFEEAVDELVPAHARAGMQLMSTSAPMESQDVLAGLDKWNETLGLILSNRRQGDVQALRSLGNLLSGYGRAEAAHICYIFARQCAVFGGLDDPNANFVLVGADHQRQADQYAKETEALQLSEVYEYGLSLAPASNVLQGFPHLAAYKLQHAMILAEYGFRDKALQYCEAIWSAITSQTKKSPYFNPVLESAVDDVMRRLKQAAGDEPSSWITKPKMDQVSSNMWSRFSKFVAGPDEDGTGNGASGEGGAEVGPFARITGGTPAVSRTPSVTNFETYGASPPMPSSRGFSAYAPVAAQSMVSSYEPTGAYNPTPRSPTERTSGELSRGAHVNPYAPVSMGSSSSTSAYQPVAPLGPETSSYAPTYQSQPQASMNEQSLGYPGYQPFGSDQVPEGHGSTPAYPVPEIVPQDQPPASGAGFSLGYQPPSHNGYGSPAMGNFEQFTPHGESSSGGYEPPSYQPSSFEPPSYEPGPIDDDESENKPKMKNFMNDDDDDIPGLKPQGKSKADKDRENEEMFRKVAEEEAKRAAEEKSTKKGGWGFGGWFGGGGGKKDTPDPNKPIKAKLGEASSFVYDPDLKRWVNKKPGAENTPSKPATPPPPRAGGSTPPTSNTPLFGHATAPPPRPTPSPAGFSNSASQEFLNVPGAAPPMARTLSSQSNASTAGGPPSGPPSRPPTSLSNASSIDDLLGTAGPRKGGKKPRKSGRYVDVMAK